MTLKEIMKVSKQHSEFCKKSGLEELADWQEEMRKVCAKLYTTGLLREEEISNDLLKMANGFQCRTGEYETFHISQTYDLRSIECMSKTTAREFAEYVLLS